jgi:hypothetical protein
MMISCINDKLEAHHSLYPSPDDFMFYDKLEAHHSLYPSPDDFMY